MKRKKQKRPESPERSYVETPVLTGQYPAFGIEVPDGAYQETKRKRDEKNRG